MKYLVVGGLAAALCAGAGGAAFAQTDDKCFDKVTLRYVDCPKEEAAMMEPVRAQRPDFSGFYAGLHAGYGWASYSGQHADGDVNHFSDIDADGFVGGGQIGYLHQTEDRYVIGFEVSGSWLAGEDTSTDGVPANNDSATAGMDWIADARLRAGVAWHYVMPYVTGGVAMGGYKADIVDAGATAATIDEIAFGGVAGAGFEWMIDPSVTIGAEGLYYFFDDSNTVDVNGTATPFAQEEVGVVRARLNFRF